MCQGDSRARLHVRPHGVVGHDEKYGFYPEFKEEEWRVLSREVM